MTEARWRSQVSASDKPAMDQTGHPLTDSMRRAGSLNKLFEFPLRDRDQEGWVEASSLFQGDHQRLRDLVITYGQKEWATDNRHIAGSAFILAYLIRVTWPLVSQYVLERRVVNVTLDNLALRLNGGNIVGTALNSPSYTALPEDPASRHPDAHVVPDEAALYARLKESMFDANLDLVIPSLRQAAGASLKVSWNAVAASFGQVFNKLHESAGNPETIVNLASAFFSDPSSPLYEQVTMDVIGHKGKKGFFSRRAGCCLWWKTQGWNDYCSNCILLSREEQDQRFREILDVSR